jgi:hypothetical protein
MTRQTVYVKNRIVTRPQGWVSIWRKLAMIGAKNT